MRFEEILMACASGKMPTVQSSVPIKFADSVIGEVVVIKNHPGSKGVGVRFPGLNYDTWFHDSDEKDARSKCIEQLTLVEGGER